MGARKGQGIVSILVSKIRFGEVNTGNLRDAGRYAIIEPFTQSRLAEPGRIVQAYDKNKQTCKGRLEYMHLDGTRNNATLVIDTFTTT